jgi:uncharacterized protein YcfJ
LGREAGQEAQKTIADTSGIVNDVPALPPVDTESQKRRLAKFTGAGAAVGGLGSLVYGKLSNRPDLQRDLLSALVGAGAGAATHLATKEAAEEKEAVFWPLFIPAAIAAGFYGKEHIQGIESRAEQEQAALDAYNRSATAAHEVKTVARAAREAQRKQEAEKAQEEATSRKVKRGATGAAMGGVVGGAGSHLYGKATGKENIKRDILAALAGGALGGTAGVLTAKD